MRFKSSLWQSGMAFAMVQKFLGVGMETAESVREAWVYCGNKVFHTLMSCTNAERVYTYKWKKLSLQTSDAELAFQSLTLVGAQSPLSHPCSRSSFKPFTFQEVTPAIVCQPISNVRFLSFPEMEFVIEHY